jgi:hypothetical protein
VSHIYRFKKIAGQFGPQNRATRSAEIAEVVIHGRFR